MNNIKTLLGAVIAILLFASISFATEISYDDGVQTTSYEFDLPNFNKAVKYTLSDFNLTAPVSLNAVKTYWSDVSGASFTEKYRYKIYLADGTAVTPWSSYINDPSLGWNTYNLPSPVIISGDFFLVINAPISIFSDEMDLGADSSNSGNNYRLTGGIFTNTYQHDYMIRANILEVNTPPTMTGITDSKDPVKSSTNLSIIPKNPADEDSDALDMVCGYDPSPTTSQNGCNNYPQNENSDYDDLNCLLTSDSNEEENTIFCRLHDGTDYSGEEVVQNTDDNTPPEVDLYLGDNAGEDTIYDDDGEVFATFGVSDASQIDSCKIDWNDGDGWENVIPPATTTSDSHIYSSDGNYTVIYKCTDEVDWTNTTESNIVVDTTDPEPSVLTLNNIESDPFDTNGNLELSWTDATDANGIDYYEIWRKDDATNIWALTYTTPNSSVNTFDETGLIEDYTYTWYVKAFDPVGHSSDSNTEFAIIDTLNPSVQITSPSNGIYTNNNDITVDADYANHNNVTCRARVDSGSWFENISGSGLIQGSVTQDFDNLDEGWHRFTVECTDLADLTGTDSVRVFVDTVAPVVDLYLGDLPYSSTEYDNDGMPWARLRNSDNRPSSRYSCEINWGNGWNSINKRTRIRGNYYSTDGWKEVEYRCTDRAGNVGQTSDTILVDRVYPVSSHELPNNACGTDWYNEDVDVVLTAVDQGYANTPQTGSGIDKIRYSFSGGIGTFMDYSGPITVSDEGVTTIYYYARDNAGNWEIFNTGLNTVQVKIDTIEPEAHIVFPVNTEHIANNNVSFTGYANDSGEFSGSGSGIQYVELQVEKASDGSIVLPWAMATGEDSWAYTWIGDENIEYILKARATDNACNVESTDVREFTLQDDYDWRYYTKEEIDTEIDEILDEVEELEESQNATQEQLDNLQMRIANAIRQINLRLDGLDSRMDNVEGNITLIHRRISRIHLAIRTLFDDVDDLQEDVAELSGRLSNLEDEVEQLQLVVDEIADFGMEYDQDDQELYLDGSGAPNSATRAKIYIKTVDGNSVDFIEVSVNTDGTFEYTFDVSNWKIEGMNIYVKFYEDIETTWRPGRGWRPRPVRPLKTIIDTWDGLLAELDYGFEHVSEKEWVTYFTNSPVSREITYSVKPHVDGLSEWIFDGGLYRIELVQMHSETQEDITQVLEACTWLAADVENSFISTISVPAVGEYLTYLKVEKAPFCRPRNSEIMTSNRFPINLRDLKDEAPNAELEVVSPEENNNDIYWTQSDNEFTLVAAAELSCGAQENVCRVRGREYVPEVSGEEYGEFDLNEIMSSSIWPNTFELDLVGDDGYYADCVEPITSTDDNINGILGDGEEGIYEVMVSALSIACEAAVDTVLIGVDDTPPIILEIFPSEENSVSGEVLFTTNVSDTLSGVEFVDMSLILKSSSELEWIHAATYNETTGFWEVMVNTAEVPDGSYNITVDAWDYARNYQTLTIDPIIDNTAPNINITSVNYVNSTLYQGHFLDMVVFVSDNYKGIIDDSEVSGIGDVTVTIGSTICTLVQAAGDNISGAFETENCLVSEDIGSYTLSVMAVDQASNNPNVAYVNETVDVLSPVLEITETCTVANTANISINGTTIDFNSTCGVNDTAKVTLVVPGKTPPETVTWDFYVNGSRSVFIIGDFIISAETAEIVEAYYDAETKELVFTGNGTGTQDVWVYVGDLGDAVKVLFDDAIISSSVYNASSKTIVLTVTYGSPHETIISWFVPAAPAPTPDKPARSSRGSSNYCYPGWECGDWSVCSDGTQTRTCNDLNSCNTLYNKPLEAQNCSVETNTAPAVLSDSSRSRPKSPVATEKGPVEAPSSTNVETAGAYALGGFITANVPSIFGGIIGIILLATILFFTFRHRSHKGHGQHH